MRHLFRTYPVIRWAALLSLLMLIARELALELVFGSAADWLKSNVGVLGEFLVWRWSSFILAVLVVLTSVLVQLKLLEKRESVSPERMAGNAAGSDAANVPSLQISGPVTYPNEHIIVTGRNMPYLQVEMWRINVSNATPRTIARNVRVVLSWSNPPIPSLPFDLHFMHDNTQPFDRHRNIRGEEPPLYVDVVGLETVTASPFRLYLYRSDLPGGGYVHGLSNGDMKPLIDVLKIGWPILFHIEAIPDPPTEKREQTYRLRLTEPGKLDSGVVMEPFRDDALAPERQRRVLRSALNDLRTVYYRELESFTDDPSLAVGWARQVEEIVESALDRDQLAKLMRDEGIRGTYFEKRFTRLSELIDRLDEVTIRPDW